MGKGLKGQEPDKQEDDDLDLSKTDGDELKPEDNGIDLGF